MVHAGKGQPAVRNYLSAALSSSGYSVGQPALSDWKKAKKQQYLHSIQQLPDSLRSALLQEADQALLFNWPALPATSFLEFKESGARTGFERKQDERRKHLCNLVVGQLIAGGSKYLPSLVNGLWATLEESTWEIPAIVVLQKAGAGLPDPAEEVIGLVNAETAVQMGAILFLLRDELDAVSPMLAKRINSALNERIFRPYLSRNDFWWMGFSGQPVNNWNVWINQNIFQAALLSDLSADSINRVMEKVFRSTDFFVNQYPDDGGCDEGPAYWSLAGGKLIRLLTLASEVSGDRLRWPGNELLHRMGRYILEVHIDGSYFVNFADATSRSFPNPEAVYRYGVAFDDAGLRLFAASLLRQSPRFSAEKSITDFIEMATVYKELRSISGDAPASPYHFFTDLGVYTMRSGDNRLYTAVKAGNNGESHNHNDVGNFIVYSNGRPVIVDAGVGVYTAQTFSDRRYELWNMQSQWHNCPTINGVMQRDGKNFKADAVSAAATGKAVTISMDIAGAYPSSAAVARWQRTFRFDRTKAKLVLTDRFRLATRKDATSLHFMSCAKPVKTGEGWMLFTGADGEPALRLHYDAKKMSVKVEEKLMDDDRLKASWGDRLYRLTLTVTDASLQQYNQVEFYLP